MATEETKAEMEGQVMKMAEELAEILDKRINISCRER